MQRGQSDYEYRHDVDLNPNSSSKLVSLQNQGHEPFTQTFPGFPNQGPPPGYIVPHGYPPYVGYGGFPDMMKTGPQQPNYAMTNNPAEIFMLRNQVMELNQALAREIEANKV